jgi:hypothetical protein
MESSIESPSSSNSSSSSSPSPSLQASTTTLSPATSSMNVSLFNGNGIDVNGIESSFSSGNGEEVAVEPLEKNPSDGKDENCKHCQ